VVGLSQWYEYDLAKCPWPLIFEQKMGSIPVTYSGLIAVLNKLEGHSCVGLCGAIGMMEKIKGMVKESNS